MYLLEKICSICQTVLTGKNVRFQKKKRQFRLRSSANDFIRLISISLEAVIGKKNFLYIADHFKLNFLDWFILGSSKNKTRSLRENPGAEFFLKLYFSVELFRFPVLLLPFRGSFNETLHSSINFEQYRGEQTNNYINTSSIHKCTALYILNFAMAKSC